METIPTESIIQATEAVAEVATEVAELATEVIETVTMEQLSAWLETLCTLSLAQLLVLGLLAGAVIGISLWRWLR